MQQRFTLAFHTHRTPNTFLHNNINIIIIICDRQHERSDKEQRKGEIQFNERKKTNQKRQQLICSVLGQRRKGNNNIGNDDHSTANWENTHKNPFKIEKLNCFILRLRSAT